MLKLLRFVILFLTYVLLIDRSEVNCTKIKCSLYTGWMPGSLNACHVNSANHNGIFASPNVTIDGIEGGNVGGKSFDEIKALYINEVTNINYLPKNLTNFFKNIEGFQISDSNLQEIRKDDLQPFKNLKYLHLFHNKITTIEKNLFEFNPNLEYIGLQNNQISHIDPNVFDNLDKLNVLRLSANNCTTAFKNAQNRTEVLSVIKRIQKGECASQKSEEVKCKNLTQNITLLQAENEKLSTKVSEFSVNYSSAISDKEICVKNLNECQSKVSNEEQMDKNRLLLQDANQMQRKLLEKEEKITNLMGKLIELQEKNENLQKSLDESKNLGEKCEKRLIIAEHSNAELIAKNNVQSEIVEKLNEVSNQIELIKNINGKNTAQNQATDNDCLTLYYGPHQHPIILSN